MKIIIASHPADGHVNPLLGTARLLVQLGHEVIFYTGSVYRGLVELTGATFAPLPDEIDFDLRDVERVFPDRAGHAPGPQRMLHDFENILMGPMGSQYRRLKELMLEFEPDVIIYEHLFYGVVPLLLQQRHMRPAMIGCGTTYLATPRLDGAAHGPGLPFVTDEIVRDAYRRIVSPITAAAIEPVQELYVKALSDLGLEAYGTRFDTVTTLFADVYWQTTVPSFEYPQADRRSNVTFVGSMPKIPSPTPLPSWAADVDRFERVVFVTQGTVANDDFDDLVRPVLIGLADIPDALVVASTGGRAVESLKFDIPENARVATYLPFDWLMPKVDLMITNGGYGTVNRALAEAIPIIIAGSTEDKPEVAARIAWSGVGINLATGNPSPDAIRQAYDRIFVDEKIRNNSQRVAAEFHDLNSAKLILDSLNWVMGAKVSQRWALTSTQRSS